MTKNPLRFVLVKWDDAWKTSTGEASPETSGEEHKAEVEYSAGWVLRDDEEGIQLGASYSVGKREDGRDWIHRNRSFVPRKMVAEVIEMTIAPKRKKKEKPSAKRIAGMGDGTASARTGDVDSGPAGV